MRVGVFSINGSPTKLWEDACPSAALSADVPEGCLVYNNNTHANVYGAVIMTKAIANLREFVRFIWWMQTERRVAANPQTKPAD